MATMSVTPKSRTRASSRAESKKRSPEKLKPVARSLTLPSGATAITLLLSNEPMPLTSRFPAPSAAAPKPPWKPLARVPRGVPSTWYSRTSPVVVKSELRIASTIRSVPSPASVTPPTRSSPLMKLVAVPGTTFTTRPTPFPAASLTSAAPSHQPAFDRVGRRTRVYRVARRGHHRGPRRGRAQEKRRQSPESSPHRTLLSLHEKGQSIDVHEPPPPGPRPFGPHPHHRPVPGERDGENLG